MFENLSRPTRKIMQIFDTSKDSLTYASHEFNSPQKNGTIEFWVFHPNDSFYIRLKSNSEVGPSLIIKNNFDVFDWHHIRIDFECSEGMYCGLESNEYRLTIDGISLGDFYYYEPTSNIQKFEIITNKGRASFRFFYIDAVGYSWDPNYDIGDNLN